MLSIAGPRFEVGTVAVGREWGGGRSKLTFLLTLT